MSDNDNVRLLVAQRWNVAFTAASATAIDESMAREGLSRVDIINRAVQVYNEIQAVVADGGVILVRNGNGEIQKWEIH